MTALAGTAPVPTVLAGSIEEPRVGEEPTPSSPYAAAKAAASRYALLFHSLYGLPVTTLRIAMVYGPGQPDATTSRSGLARHCSRCAGGTPGCE
jgi:nucleoside-diphosphate-sugar epimerase